VDDREPAGVVLDEGHRREDLPGGDGAVGGDQVHRGAGTVGEDESGYAGHRPVAAPLAQPQAAGHQPPHHLGAARRRRAGREHCRVPLLRHVVVVALERPRVQPDPLREGVQLFERRVADEVSEDRAVAGPDRLVDPDGHRRSR
jgi:hypothetical protein